MLVYEKMTFYFPGELNFSRETAMLSFVSACALTAQPRPQGLLSIQNGGPDRHFECPKDPRDEVANSTRELRAKCVTQYNGIAFKVFRYSFLETIPNFFN